MSDEKSNISIALPFVFLIIMFSFAIPHFIELNDKIELQELQIAKIEAHRLSDLAYEYMKENMPAGCSFSGDSRYVTCLDISISVRDSYDYSKPITEIAIIDRSNFGDSGLEWKKWHNVLALRWMNLEKCWSMLF